MKAAVFSDIHSNHIALEACLEEAEKHEVDAFIFLGDYISDCPYPKKTLSLIKEVSQKYPAFAIKGNREEYIIRHDKAFLGDWLYGSPTGSLLYTYDNLISEDIKALEKLPFSDTLSLDKLAVTICHGSPANSREALLPDSDETKGYLKQTNTRLLLCGHTHCQYAYEYQGKKLVNSGSVGVQVDGRTEARFAILHIDADQVEPEFLSVKYDIDRALREFEESGLFYKGGVWSRAVIKALKTGVNYPEICFSRANELARGENAMDEKIWLKAAEQLEI